MVDLSAIFGDNQASITLTLSAVQWLAIAAALRVMDDDLMEDEGVLPGMAAPLQDAFDTVDEAVSEVFGKDWPVLVTTQERLDMEEEDRGSVIPPNPVINPNA